MSRQPATLRYAGVVLLGLLIASSSFAQKPPTGMPHYEPQIAGLLPNSDRDAESWLAKARDAAAQEDWKLAADTLMRVIDQSGDKTVSTDGGRHFTSALRCAQEQIAAWPEAGLAAYRLLYDPEAKQRYDRAVQAHDLDELRNLARKYTFTSVGPAAMNLLAAWLIDLQLPAEAIDLLDDLLHLSGHDMPKWQILIKLSAAYALDGEMEAAAHCIDDLRKEVNNAAQPPNDIEKQIESLQAFLDEARRHTVSAAHIQRGDDWPVLLGPAAAAGRMASIHPAVTPDTAMTAPLPGARPSHSGTIAKLIEKTGRPPVWQAVSDGRALFITSPEGLIARDLGTFEFLWQAVPKSPRRDSRIDQFRARTGMSDADNDGRLDEFSTRALWHEYRGVVSTALGLVFIIEQHGTNNEQFPTRAGAAPPNNIFYNEELAEPNSLRAYEADTGRVAWTKGRGGPLEDDLRLAHFYAPPVHAGGRLISPFQVGADLYLGIFERSGKPIRRVLLGTGQPGVFPMNGILQPTVHENTIYVQTGAGLFMALNSHDFSLRWLASYDRADGTVSRQAPARQWGPNGVAMGGLAQPDEWTCAPALIAGGVVAVAPHDSQSVLAFDRRTGELKWSFPRGSYRYLIGADDRRVFIAGKGLLAIDLATGMSAWSYRKTKITGRPALCGKELFIPTSDGIVRIGAEKGDVIGNSLSADRPIGNLVALDGALYSVTADAISKFPDIDQSREIAMARLRENPADIRALLRLAGLESVGGDWRKALGLLEQADRRLVEPPIAAASSAPAIPSREEQAELLDRVTHQRVRAFLNLATETDPPQRRGFLEQACAAAKRPADVLNAGLTLCDFLAALRENDSPAGVSNHVAAFRRLIDLVESFGDESVFLSEEVRAAAGVQVQDRLRRLWAGLPDSSRSGLAQELEARRNSAVRIGKWQELIRLADALDFLAGGARMDLDIGKHQFANGEVESAVFFLERAARRANAEGRNAKATLRCEANARLACAYLHPGESLPGSPVDALRLVKLLQHEEPQAPLPADLSPLPGRPACKNVGELLTGIRETLPGRLFESSRPTPEILRGMPRLSAIGDDAVPGGLADVRSFYDPSAPADLFSEILPLRILRHIKGYSMRADGAPLTWACELDASLEDFAPAPERGVEVKAHDSIISGRVALFDAGTQLVAVGLTSGRALWPAIPFDPIGRPPPSPIAVQKDYVIYVAPDDATLLAIPARSDARPFWVRSFSNVQLGILGFVEGRLVVTDRASTQAMLLDPGSGRTLSRVSLVDGRSAPTENEKTENKADDAGNSPETWLGLFGKIACRGVEHALTGHDLISGEVLWTRSLQGRIQSIHRLDDRHIGISSLNQSMDVIRVDTGGVVKTITMEDLVLPPIDVTLDSPGGASNDSAGRLLLFCKTKTEPPHYVLSSHPIGAEGSAWRRDLGVGATISQQMLRASPNFVAAVCYLFKESEESPRGQIPSGPLDSVQLVIFDKTTNERLLEEPFTFEGRLMRDSFRSRMIKDVIVLDQRIIAVAPEGCYFLSRSLDEKPAHD